MHIAASRWGAVLAVSGMALLTGCAGFFPPNSTTSSTGSTTVVSGDYVYAVNPTAGTLTGYSIGSSGLTNISGASYSFASTVEPTSICVSGTNAFVYVGGVGGIYGYSISSTGALTAIDGGAQLGQNPIAQLSCSSDGNWVVGLDNATAQIDEYEINTTTGVLGTAVLTALTYPTAGTTFSNKMIRFSPLEGYVVAALGNAGVSVYTFNSSTGALTYQYNESPTSTQVNFNGVAVDSTDTNLYIAETNGILGFTVATNVAIPGLTQVGTGGTNPGPIVVTKNDNFLYVGNEYGSTGSPAAGSIAEYSFASSVPQALTGSPVSGTGFVQSLARDNSGGYLVAGLGGTATDLALYSFSTTTTGALNSAPATASTSSSSDSGLFIATTH